MEYKAQISSFKVKAIRGAMVNRIRDPIYHLQRQVYAWVTQIIVVNKF